MADMKGLSGSIVALVTPFAEDGSVDFEALGRLVDFHLANGADALLTLGTTGESSTMSHEEDDEVCKFVVDRVAGRVPVIAGSGSNSTQTMLEKSLSFQKMGADGLLLITPYYNKSNEEGIYRHFTTVLDAVDIPCILYNVPGRTGCSISEKNVARLAKHPNAFGIKEASGNIGYATKIARYLSDDFCMFSGNDDIVVPMMALGSRGVISVWANVQPKEVHDMCHAWLAGDHAAALETQLAGIELVDSLFCDVNPIPVKEAMNLLGHDAGQCRMPLAPVNAANRERLRTALCAAGFLKA